MTERRRLVLAVDDPALRRELTELFARERLEVRLVPPGTALAAVDADAVLLSADDLGGEHLERLAEARDDEAPGVVVLGEDEDPTDEARLIAGGASAVVDAGSEPAELREELLGLVEAEAEGGLHGPEVGGSEAEPKLADFRSSSPRMRAFLELVARVADSDSTLLVTGETGVGKERLARAIHAESARSGGPFVAVNCGALPENLLESELFGHERGAFTGATEARQGRFEAASGGTILLDEIGEMPPHLQVKLLTVLQRHEVRRLGDTRPRPVDVRVVSATNRDLAEDVRAGRFREDLLYRLNVIALEIPPLRERPEDLPRLVGRFLRHFAEAHGRPEVREVEEAAMEKLLAYSWPGNVREVVNVIERAVLLCRGDRIRLADLPEPVRRGSAGAAPALAGRSPEAPPVELLELSLQEAKRRVVADFERAYLTHHLHATEGTLRRTAERAGIDPRTLYEKMRRYGLSKDEFRPGR